MQEKCNMYKYFIHLFVMKIKLTEEIKWRRLVAY